MDIFSYICTIASIFFKKKLICVYGTIKIKIMLYVKSYLCLRSIAQVFIHKDFEKKTFNNDIALVLMSSPVSIMYPGIRIKKIDEALNRM